MLIIWLKKTHFNSKANEMEYKIPSITGLATNSALFVVENRIPDISSLVTKIDFEAKLKGINDRVASNKSKYLLVENELKKLKALDLSYFLVKNYFDRDDGTQNTLVFQVKNKYFEHSVRGPAYAYDMGVKRSI